MNKLIIALCIAMLVLGAASCKKNPVEVSEEEPENLTPGRRDYTWVADTIKNPYLDFYHIWGNSLTNLWIGSSQSNNSLYKYDGTRWNSDNRINITSPIALWGYEDKLWIGNNSGCIWQFTGSSYQEQLSYLKIENWYVNFNNMYGSSDNEIYTDCSYFKNGRSYSALLKYDGSNWKIDKILEKPCIIYQLTYSNKNNRYYLNVRYTGISGAVYEYDRTKFKEIWNYSSANIGAMISEIGGYPFLVSESKVYRYRDNKMELISEINDSKFGGIVWGRGRNDIFLRMIDGLAHYNGNDVQYQFKVPESYKMNANMAIFEKDVFISAKDFNTGYNIIYHGKLN